jgi:hypothetical protein
MTPGYGRLEIVPPPNRPLPRPAQSYSRSWRMESPPKVCPSTFVSFRHSPQ